MSTLREYYLERRRAELPVFLKVLRALPADKMDYKPHERSPTAQDLVWTLTWELSTCVTVAREHRGEWVTAPAPSIEEMIRQFETSAKELVQLVDGMEDAAWDGAAQFYYGGKKVSEQPASSFLWMVHFDAIHHRGQLTTYLRPMGSKVPAIYGPSGDERPA
jgi:uncharacterized damage-inducible protein DinB